MGKRPRPSTFDTARAPERSQNTIFGHLYPCYASYNEVVVGVVVEVVVEPVAESRLDDEARSRHRSAGSKRPAQGPPLPGQDLREEVAQGRLLAKTGGCEADPSRGVATEGRSESRCQRTSTRS